MREGSVFQPQGTVWTKEQWYKTAWQEQGRTVNTSTTSRVWILRQKAMEREWE